MRLGDFVLLLTAFRDAQLAIPSLNGKYKVAASALGFNESRAKKGMNAQFTRMTGSGPMLIEILGAHEKRRARKRGTDNRPLTTILRNAFAHFVPKIEGLRQCGWKEAIIVSFFDNFLKKHFGTELEQMVAAIAACVDQNDDTPGMLNLCKVYHSLSKLKD